MKKTRTRVVKSSKLSSIKLLVSKLKIYLLSFGICTQEQTSPLTPLLGEEKGIATSGNKTNHGPLDTRYGFTLVELIVVIVILGVLATVGFLAFADYPKQARDTVRIAHLREIEKGLEFYKIREGDYPIPTGGQTNTGEIEGYSGIVWHKGTFGADIISQIPEITKLPTDPKDNTEYTYELTEDLQSYRLGTTLELKDKNTGTKEYTARSKVTVEKNIFKTFSALHKDIFSYTGSYEINSNTLRPKDNGTDNTGFYFTYNIPKNTNYIKIKAKVYIQASSWGYIQNMGLYYGNHFTFNNRGEAYMISGKKYIVRINTTTDPLDPVASGQPSAFFSNDGVSNSQHSIGPISENEGWQYWELEYKGQKLKLSVYDENNKLKHSKIYNESETPKYLMLNLKYGFKHQNYNKIESIKIDYIQSY